MAFSVQLASKESYLEDQSKDFGTIASHILFGTCATRSYLSISKGWTTPENCSVLQSFKRVRNKAVCVYFDCWPDPLRDALGSGIRSPTTAVTKYHDAMYISPNQYD